MLINGKWAENWQPVQATDGKGGFVRQESSFRSQINADALSQYPAQAGRYHLYVAAVCPWANRTLIARALKKLGDVVSVSVVEPFVGDQGWMFGTYPGSDSDEVNGARYLHELYTQVEPLYNGRATVPILWDKQTGTIINNESADIVRMFNEAFGELTTSSVDLYPAAYRDEIDMLNQRLYKNFNNGVYRTGFATTQLAYEEAVLDLFETLSWLEKHLTGRQYLVSEQITEADIRAFVTMIRFEPVYYSLFKCNHKHLWQYGNVWSYLQRLYALPSFQNTVNFDHIKQGYYSIKALNPNGIVPIGPGDELQCRLIDVNKHVVTPQLNNFFHF